MYTVFLYPEGTTFTFTFTLAEIPCYAAQIMSNFILKIGALHLTNNIILAPMAGITNSPYRQIFIRAGAGMVYSEMISANGLIRDGRRTLELLRRSDSEKPLAIQLFGDDPAVLADAAAMVSGHGEALDLNMGCPVKKVVRSGAGSALLQNPHAAYNAIAAVRQATRLPLTVKIRSGWDLGSVNFLQIGKLAEQAGADAIILHPRTRCQGFGGHSNWAHISELKRAVNIPVIGSGDIAYPEDALRMLDQTGCDGVMIGRGGYGNPWLITNILRLQQGIDTIDAERQQRLETALYHLFLHQQHFGGQHTHLEMRKHLCWYSRGLPGAGEFRALINRTVDYHDLVQALTRFFSRPE